MSLPADREARFKDVISEVLADAGRLGFADATRRHNEIVRGWRNYYGAVSDRLDGQLLALDAWRRPLCAALLRSGRLDDALVDVAFECLSPAPSMDSPTGYPNWEAHESEPGDVEPLEGGRTPPWSSTASLRIAARATRQTPIVYEDGELRIPTHGAYLTNSKQMIVIRLKRRVVLECPLNIVDHVVIEASGVAVSGRVVIACAMHRIPVVFTTGTGLPAARLVPARTAIRPGLIDAQVTARASEVGTAIAREMIVAKIANQRSELLRCAKYPGRAPEVRNRLRQSAMQIADLLSSLEQASPGPIAAARSGLLLSEARAAAWYWRAVAALMPSRFAFHRRRGRGASDPVNVLLNYAYWQLFQRVWRAVERRGLSPFLGLIHTGRRGAPGLVPDLMEKFRQPSAGRVVLAQIGRRSAIQIDAGGRRTLRMRRLVADAFARTLERRDRGAALGQRITQQAALFALAVQGRQRYEAYRSRW